MTLPEQDPWTACIGFDRYSELVRLPVAPRVNHRLRFAPMNQQKARHLQPVEAVEVVRRSREQGQQATAVLLHGPGDPLADLAATLETVTRLNQYDPDLHIVVRTLGFGGLQSADKLAKAGVKEVEITIEGTSPDILGQIYAWVRPGFKTLKLDEALAILIDEQPRSIRAFKDAGLVVQVLTSCFPTINLDQIPQLARIIREQGADGLLLRPHQNCPDADIQLPPLASEQLEELVSRCEPSLPTQKIRPEQSSDTSRKQEENQLPTPGSERPNLAVVSSNGMDIDLHLGQAPKILIYGPREDGLISLLESRNAPDPGSGELRWEILARTLPDCFALLAASAGERPRKILGRHGVPVLIANETVEGTVDVLYGGKDKGRNKRRINA